MVATVAIIALVTTLVVVSPASAEPPAVPKQVYQDVPGSSAPAISDVGTPASSTSVIDAASTFPVAGTFTIQLGPTSEIDPPVEVIPPSDLEPTPTPTGTSTPQPTPTPTATVEPSPAPSSTPSTPTPTAAPATTSAQLPALRAEDPAPVEPVPADWQTIGNSGIAVSGAAGSAKRSLDGSAPTAAEITVTILSEKERRLLGLNGIALSFERTDGAADEVPVDVKVPAALLDGLYGADYSSRVNWVEVQSGRGKGKTASISDSAGDENNNVESRPDEDGSTILTPTVGAAPMIVTALSSPISESGTGDFSASDLKPASSWDISAQTGGFAWTYPMSAPPAPAGPQPSVALSYSSQSVDGETGSTNNQPSVIGDGWQLSGAGFIERTYVSCAKDDGSGGPVTSSGDLCWKSDNATISFGSHSGPIIRDSSGVWKLEQDDGSRIEQLKGTSQGCASNGTYNIECWRLTTTDGTQYFFGLNQLPGWTTGSPTTNSAWTVPVFGNDGGEPCNTPGTFATSSCYQGWRWNLDYIVDIHGNAQALYYHAETNQYARNGVGAAPYIRGGSLDKIEYGLKASTVFATNAATGKIVFGYNAYGRCNDTAVANCTAQPLNGMATTPTTPSKYPDVPYDQNCTGATCTDLTSPTFWSVAQLDTVTTQVLAAETYSVVDVWALGHSFPDPGDSTSAALWLTKITHTGYAGATALTEPDVIFSGITMQNRVWAFDGLAPLDKYRISSVRLETGGTVAVNYSGQDCTVAEVSTILANVQNNHRRCYPQWWTPDSLYPQPPQLDLFHKYVVTSTVASPVTGGGADQPLETYYDYSVGTPSWRYNDSPFTPADYRTWSSYAGYDRVDIRVGSPTSPATQQTSQYTFFQGMDGDRASPSGGTKSVTVTGTAVTDSLWLAGRTYQVKELVGASGPVASTTVTTPWVSSVKASNGYQSSRMVRDGTVQLTVPLSTGGSRTTSTVTTFDDTYGTALTSSQNNELGTVSTCTVTSYATPNLTAWIVGAVEQQTTVGKQCIDLGTVTYPADSVSSSRYLYDGLAYGATPTKGDVTEVRTIGSFTGSTANWITQSTSLYDSMGRMTSATDAMGRTTTTAYTPSATAPSGSGPLTTQAVTNPKLWTTTKQIEPTRGNVISVTDTNNKVTTAAYDALGRTISVWATDRPAATFPTSPTVSYSYVQSTTTVSSVATTTLTPSAGIVSYALFDGLGRQVQSQSPADGSGTVIADSEYDSAGRVSATNGSYWTTSVSPSGTLFVPFTVAQIPSRTQYTFDGLGRTTVQALVSAGVERSRVTYAFSGVDRTDMTPPAGGTPTKSIVNSLGQETSLTQFLAATPDPLATQVTTQYTYDPQGHMATMRDAVNNVWSWSYDALGRLTEAVDPDAGTSRSTYDLAGNVLTSTDGRGVVLSYTYDDLDRKTFVRETSPTGPVLASWVYDTLDKGQLTSSTTYTGSVAGTPGLAYTVSIGDYDDAYRSLSTTTTIPVGADAFGGTTYTEELSYLQDGSPNILKLPAAGGLPAESLRWTYGATGKVAGLRSGTSTYLSGVAYTPIGQVGQYTRPGSASTITAYGYDQATAALMTITESTLTGASYTNTASRSYTRDKAGNVTSATTTATGVTTDTQCFTYDYLQNLTAAWTPTSNSCVAAPTSTTLGGPAPYWSTYAVDTITGNRTQSVTKPVTSGGVATTQNYTYPTTASAPPHAVSAVATQVGTGTPTTATYGYDTAGNTTTRPGQVLEYDKLGHLKKTTIGTVTQKNVYDANGALLLRFDSAAGSTLFLGMTELRTAAGSPVVAAGTRTYSAHGSPIAERNATAGVSGSVLKWVTTDLVGTSLMQILSTSTTSAGVTRRYVDPFGKPRGTVPSWSSNHSYLNAPSSATTGLTHLGAREYDPALGRFATVDAVLTPGNPQQNNGYSYSRNSPVTFSDPTGNHCDGCGDPRLGGGPDGSKAHSGPGSPPPAASIPTSGDFWDGFGDGWNSAWQVSVDYYTGIWDTAVGTAAGIWAFMPARYIVWTMFDPSGALGGLLESASGPTSALAAFATDPGGTFDEVVDGVVNEVTTRPGHALGGLAFTALTVAVPGGAVAGLSAKAGLTADGFNGLTNAAQLGLASYRDLRKLTTGTGLDAHHLIEQRFAPTLGVEANTMLSVAVTKAEHQVFTNAWRTAIGYGAGTQNATPAFIMQTAANIYADYSAILTALGIK